MEEQFWKERWENRELRFHLPFVHPILKRSLPLFNLSKGSRVFLPLCGKTLDIGYLLSEGYSVVGVELSEIAVSELFDELGVKPEVSGWAGGQCWRHGELTVFQGDFFALTAEQLGVVDLVYDRAAMVALPAEMCERYAVHLPEITAGAPILLICFEYDQSRMAGPPFAVPDSKLERLYAGRYKLAELSRKDVIAHQPAFLEAGLEHFEEISWLLAPR